MRAGGRTPITIRRFDAESGIPGPGMPLLFCSLRFFLRPQVLGGQGGAEGTVRMMPMVPATPRMISMAMESALKIWIMG